MNSHGNPYNFENTNRKHESTHAHTSSATAVVAVTARRHGRSSSSSCCVQHGRHHPYSRKQRQHKDSSLWSCCCTMPSGNAIRQHRSFCLVDSARQLAAVVRYKVYTYNNKKCISSIAIIIRIIRQTRFLGATAVCSVFFFGGQTHAVQ